MSNPSVAYFILHQTEHGQTELCANPSGKITIRETVKGELVSEIFLTKSTERSIENIQHKLDELVNFLTEHVSYRSIDPEIYADRVHFDKPLLD